MKCIPVSSCVAVNHVTSMASHRKPPSFTTLEPGTGSSERLQERKLTILSVYSGSTNLFALGLVRFRMLQRERYASSSTFHSRGKFVRTKAKTSHPAVPLWQVPFGSRFNNRAPRNATAKKCKLRGNLSTRASHTRYTYIKPQNPWFLYKMHSYRTLHLRLHLHSYRTLHLR